mgnify:CR=1 FL=1
MACVGRVGRARSQPPTCAVVATPVPLLGGMVEQGWQMQGTTTTSQSLTEPHTRTHTGFDGVQHPTRRKTGRGGVGRTQGEALLIRVGSTYPLHNRFRPSASPHTPHTPNHPSQRSAAAVSFKAWHAFCVPINLMQWAKLPQPSTHFCPWAKAYEICLSAERR